MPPADQHINQNNPTGNIDNKNQIQPAAVNAVYYKIQIAATQKSGVKDSHWFTLNYKIDSPVELTYHEGWKKYLVGSFLGYNEAIEFKRKTQEKITDAFIVAYQNGNRIPFKAAMKSTAMNQ